MIINLGTDSNFFESSQTQVKDTGKHTDIKMEIYKGKANSYLEKISRNSIEAGCDRLMRSSPEGRSGRSSPSIFVAENVGRLGEKERKKNNM
ncbi:hypothetical protein FXO38_34941 [Capsicum annuum]|nr:hypothetical protein FXO38_34941 [Capsicum annuum]KAF3628688.1 hypothetical protein FXO37_29264 [Capsicum annuum]